MLRVLIVEDDPARQDILKKLFKDHAWIIVHTAERAIRMVQCYDFDLICLDYDLATEQKAIAVAEALVDSPNATTKVLIHSMNEPGARRIQVVLPEADYVPISKITKTNETFRRLRDEFNKGVHVDWDNVF